MKITSILFIFVFLVGCSLKIPTKYERNPSEVGYPANSLKKSKCACLKFYEDGEYL